ISEELLEIYKGEGLIEVYNGQLPDNQKKDVIKEWNTGQIYLIIATSVFGMGIDIPDVRLVLYYNILMNMSRAGQIGKIP
ncbi:16530_t:CDS:2, partial [Gigaspora margarita]